MLDEANGARLKCVYLIGTAYIADTKLLVNRFLPHKYRTDVRGVIVGVEGDDVELNDLEAEGHKAIEGMVSEKVTTIRKE